MPRRYTKTNYKTRDAWLNDRGSYIGGSDIARIVNLSRFGDALSGYVSKTQPKGPIQKTLGPMFWGHALEKPIMDAFHIATGFKPKPNGLTVFKLRNSDHMACTPDALIHNENKDLVGLEIKTSRIMSTWPAGNEKVTDVGTGSQGNPDQPENRWKDALPPDVVCQVQWSLGITGYSCWYVAALLQGSDLRIFRVTPDKGDFKFLKEKANEFWENNVLAGIPPEPTEKTNPSDLAKLYPDALNKDVLKIENEVEISNACYMYFSAAEAVKTAQSTKEFMASKVKALMKDHEIATIVGQEQGYTAKWSNKPGNRRVDMALLEANYPDVYKEVYKQGPEMRVFRLKKEKS